MSYWNKDKDKEKKRTNWNQTLRSTTRTNKPRRIRKSLQYLLVLKKFNNVIDYKNVKLLKAFLNKYGKIRPRRKTKIPVQKQRAIAKAIRKSRAFGIIPFIYDVKV